MISSHFSLTLGILRARRSIARKCRDCRLRMRKNEQVATVLTHDLFMLLHVGTIVLARTSPSHFRGNYMFLFILQHFYVLVIVRKSSCTRYNGTRGGVEIVIQYEAQPSTVWSIETRHECHYIQYSLISVL